MGLRVGEQLNACNRGGSALFARHLISKTALVVSILGCSSAHAAGPTGPEGGNFPGDSVVVTEEVPGVAPRPAEAEPEGFLSFDTGYAFTEDFEFLLCRFLGRIERRLVTPGLFH